jgi:polysaccharide export outer membrane protein
MTVRLIYRAAALIAGVGLLGLAGCASYITSPVGSKHPFQDAQVQARYDKQKAADPGLASDPIWNDSSALSAPLRFAPDDVLRLSVYEHPELVTDAMVQPDGNVMLPIVGRLKAADRTPDEVRDDVRSILDARLRTSRVQLERGTVLEMLVFEHPELTHVATVQLDGMIVLPLVGQVPAAGRSIAEVQRDVQARLAQVLAHPMVDLLPQHLPLNDLAGAEISILPQKLAPRLVAVFGEVAVPGVFPIHTHMRILNALAQAHVLDSGDLNDVIVIRDRVAGRPPKYRSLRLADFAKGTAPADNIYLMADDVVIVPKTPISTLDLYIQQLFANTAAVFNWYISLQYAISAADLAREIQLINRSLQ